MDTAVSIRSVEALGEIILDNPSASEGRAIDGFDFTLVHGGLRASVGVYLHEVDSLAAYFQDLAKKWKGWKGDDIWESLEHELLLSASCDKLGHVRLKAKIQYMLGAQDSWSTQGAIIVEAGQLDRIAKEVADFLGV